MTSAATTRPTTSSSRPGLGDDDQADDQLQLVGLAIAAAIGETG